MIGAAFIILAIAGTVAAMVYETQKTIYRESSGHLVEIAHQLSERFSDKLECPGHLYTGLLPDIWKRYKGGVGKFPFRLSTDLGVFPFVFYR